MYFSFEAVCTRKKASYTDAFFVTLDVILYKGSSVISDNKNRIMRFYPRQLYLKDICKRNLLEN